MCFLITETIKRIGLSDTMMIKRLRNFLDSSTA